MGKYDTAVKCAQIKNLIDSNQYLKAMEEIEELDFAKIPSISDIYSFADLFLRAERLDVAKEMYYTVYHRTASRPSLYRLLMLVIRMGDVEEAKDLYLTYEITAGITLDTYELRYRLAKAEGAPPIRLIEILEQLKQDEYTEEWGYQLAKLYELEGMREKCVSECEDIVRWFGSGSIVDKAVELREKCLRLDWVKPVNEDIPEVEEPKPSENDEIFAHAPVSVKEIWEEPEPQLQSEEEPQDVQERQPEEEPQDTQELQPEEELQDIQELQPEEEPQDVQELQPEEEPQDIQELQSEEEPQEVEESVEEETSRKGFLRKLVNYFKVDLDDFEEEDEAFPEELDTYKQQTTAEINVKAILAEGVGDILEEDIPVPKPVKREVLEAEPDATPVVESLDDKLQEIEKHREVIKLDDTMNLEGLQIKSHPLGHVPEPEVYEDISRNGIHYLTLKGTIYRLQQNDGIANFALTGGAEGITLAVAKKLFKELKKINYFEAKNIGKISATKLDEINLGEWAEKFIGGCMYIMDAPSLSPNSVENLVHLIDKYGRQIVVILEGSYDEMDAFLKCHKEFEDKITYKIKL